MAARDRRARMPKILFLRSLNEEQNAFPPWVAAYSTPKLYDGKWTKRNHNYHLVSARCWKPSHFRVKVNSICQPDSPDVPSSRRRRIVLHSEAKAFSNTKLHIETNRMLQFRDTPSFFSPAESATNAMAVLWLSDYRTRNYMWFWKYKNLSELLK